MKTIKAAPPNQRSRPSTEPRRFEPLVRVKCQPFQRPTFTIPRYFFLSSGAKLMPLTGTSRNAFSAGSNNHTLPVLMFNRNVPWLELWMVKGPDDWSIAVLVQPINSTATINSRMRLMDASDSNEMAKRCQPIGRQPVIEDRPFTMCVATARIRWAVQVSSAPLPGPD